MHNTELCCRTCSNMIEVKCHPCNVNDLSYGPISKVMGYGCLALGIETGDRSVIFMDNKHGECEMYNEKI